METRICSKCKIEKPLTYEYFRYRDNKKIKFRNDCRDCGRYRDRQYHKDHKEQRKVYGKKFRESEHGKAIREAHRPKERQNNIELRIRVLSAYSDDDPKCQCCGETFLDFLHLDHIYGDGKEDRKNRGAGLNFYRSLELDNYPDKWRYRVLCANCNLALIKSQWTFESLKTVMDKRHQDMISYQEALKLFAEKISSAARKKYATVKPDRFPIPPGDKAHARAALRLLNRAKGLSSADKAKIRARANSVLGKGGKKK